jgi:hypothetical protein
MNQESQEDVPGSGVFERVAVVCTTSFAFTSALPNTLSISVTPRHTIGVQLFCVILICNVKTRFVSKGRGTLVAMILYGIMSIFLMRGCAHRHSDWVPELIELLVLCSHCIPIPVVL